MTPANIIDASGALDQLYQKYFGGCEPAAPEKMEALLAVKHMPKLRSFPAATPKLTLAATPKLTLMDKTLLRKAREAANGDKFSKLYDHGDLSTFAGDESRADLALCGMLAFHTDKDGDRIDRLFRHSKLMRPKWDRKLGDGTYGERTILKATGTGSIVDETKPEEQMDSKMPVSIRLDVSASDSRKMLGIRTGRELKDRALELRRGQPVVERIIPSASIGIAVGHEGLGKSPLLYEGGLCVAAGIPFLDYPVTKGAVMYFDFENGVDQVNSMVERLCGHLGLTEIPPDLFLWNANDPGEMKDVLAAIQSMRPALAIIDSLSAYRPEAEEKNSSAGKLVRELRALVAETGSTVLLPHHLRKPPADSKFKPLSLQPDNVRAFLKQARGASALISSFDFRIGIDRPHFPMPSLEDKEVKRREEVALVMGGFERVNGDLPFLYIGRTLDEDGKPLGYTRIVGAAFLPLDQRKSFLDLPSIFRFKEAKRIYNRGPQATTDFLVKCENLGLIRKNELTGLYEKTEEGTTPARIETLHAFQEKLVVPAA